MNDLSFAQIKKMKFTVNGRVYYYVGNNTFACLDNDRDNDVTFTVRQMQLLMRSGCAIPVNPKPLTGEGIIRFDENGNVLSKRLPHFGRYLKVHEMLNIPHSDAYRGSFKVTWEKIN